MLRSKILAPAAALVVVCAVGSALTRHTHGGANVLSNIFFFTLALLVLLFAPAAVAAGIRRIGTSRRSRKLET